jgi:sulfate permease, SulP family
MQLTLSKLTQTISPARLLPGLTAGLVAGVITIVVEISLAALIFSGNLAAYLPQGIGFILFGSFIIGLVVALTSSYPGSVAVPQDSPAAILAIVAAAVAAQMPASAPAESTFFTVTAALVVTSLLTGTFFVALGAFKLGGLIRYVPYPVVGGFLAGTGWLLVQGGIGVMADVSLSLAQLPALVQPAAMARWAPGLLFAVVLLAMLRRFSHLLIVPAMLFASIGLFYVFLGVTHLSMAEAEAQGWLLGPFPQAGLWQPLPLSALSQVNWPIIFGQLGNVGTIMVVGVVSLLLNASGLELATQRDIDLDRELRAAGVANCLAGLVGSPAGYHTLSESALGHKLGADSRLVGLVMAVSCGVMLFAGGSLVSFFPKLVAGGLLVFLGLAFLVEWVYDAWFKLSRVEYLIVLVITLAMAFVGVLQAVGLGLVLAVILFVVDYSRVGVVKHVFSGANYSSRVERPRLYRQLLRQKGQWLYILELQGFIFFGTANRLLDQVRQRLGAPGLPSPRFVVLDFRRVSGLDASAVLSLAKLKQLAQGRKLALIFTQLPLQLQRRLEREVFAGADGAMWHVFPDLDRGVEWCEEQMIQGFAAVGLSGRPRTAKQRLEEILSGLGRPLSWWGQFDSEDKQQGTKPAPTPMLESLMKYLERKDVEGGYCLIREGDAFTSLYFIGDGQVTTERVYPDGRKLRLRTTGAGTVVGEAGMYLGSKASASVVTDCPSTIYSLSSDKLSQMEETDPALAAAFHKFMAQSLSERLVSATDTLQSALE